MITRRDDVVLLLFLLLNVGAGIGELLFPELPDHWLVILPLLALVWLAVLVIRHFTSRPPRPTDLIAEIESWLRQQRRSRPNKEV